ncbi:MAG: hypothetical protein WA994_11675 [Ornithinimicrobium sp.]
MTVDFTLTRSRTGRVTATCQTCQDTVTAPSDRLIGTKKRNHQCITTPGKKDQA